MKRIILTNNRSGTVTSSLKMGTSAEGWTCLNKTTTTQNVCHDQVWSLESGPDGVVSFKSCSDFNILLTNADTLLGDMGSY